MDLGATRALAVDLAFSIHGVDITVARPAPEDTPIPTRGIWMTWETEQLGPESFNRNEAVKRMALKRTDVPKVPQKTAIFAPEPGSSTVLGWRVDAIDKVEAETVRVVLKRDKDLDP